MNRAKTLLMLSAMIATTFPGWTPAQEGSAGGPAPLELSLKDCIKAAFENNKQIHIDSYLPELRAQDILLSESSFDPNLVFTGLYEDQTSPTNNFFDIGNLLDPNQINFNQPFSTLEKRVQEALLTPVSIDSTQTSLDSRYVDPLRLGGFWSAGLFLARFTSSSANAFFPESYYSNLQFSFTQPFLKNFGSKINETRITLAKSDQEIDTETFRQRVQDTLLEVESAYWTLVFERQDLEVRKEALTLAQELLRLNRIRVDVGTLPPIDITQAEAGVASREEAVIIAESNIRNAEDRLRRVLGMDPQSPDWRKPVVPIQDLNIVERVVDLDREIKKGIENRTDLEAARLQLQKADTSLSFQRNQLKYRLDGTGTVGYEGLSGDTEPIPVFDANGQIFGVVGGINTGVQDALEFSTDGSFPTWSVQLVLGIPIGNRSSEVQYTRSRLQREERSIEYENLEQAAIVEVGQAARKVITDRKRIDAAEKNRILQEKTVEAEQKKFENGLSTSFQVLEFQKDLAEARSAENSAKRDYRVSLAGLDAATGVLDQTYNIKIADYSRE